MNHFELLGRSGAGANSSVWKCRDARTGNIVAVKKIEGGSSLNQALAEAALTRVCAHKHVIGLLEMHQGSSSNTIYMVLEHCEATLARELLLSPRGLPLPRAKLLAYQLLQALEHLHVRQVCHRDLKPGNILLGPGYTVKLCDFGSAYSPVLGSDLVHDPTAQGGSAAITAALDNIASSPFGTSSAAGSGTGPLAVAAASRWYCAPESLLGGGASPASDVWAFGCILAELVTGKPLLQGSEEDLDQLCMVVAAVGGLSGAQEALLRLLPHQQRQRLEEARARGPLLDKMPKVTACPALLDLLRAALQPDPALRPSAQQLQQHAFFADLRQALAQCEAQGNIIAAAAGSCLEPATSLPGPLQPATSGPLDALPFRGYSAAAVLMDVDGVGPVTDCIPGADSLPSPAASPGLPDSPSRRSEGGAPASVFASTSFRRAPAGGFGVGPGTASAGVGVGVGPRAAFSSVQGAVPHAPVPRARISALTATIRGRAFGEADGEYVDLMPRVEQLVGRWSSLADLPSGLGPIAMAARSASLAAARSSDISFPLPLALSSGGVMGASTSSAGGSPPALDTVPTLEAAGLCPAAMVPCRAPSAPGADQLPMDTPIAAAAGGSMCSPGGGCGLSNQPFILQPQQHHHNPLPQQPVPLPPASPPPPVPAPSAAAPMDCTPSPRSRPVPSPSCEATALPTRPQPPRLQDECAASTNATDSPAPHISSSVGATPFLTQSVGSGFKLVTSPASVNTTSASQARSKAIVNRARRNQREQNLRNYLLQQQATAAVQPQQQQEGGEQQTGDLASSCPQRGSRMAGSLGSLGHSATLLQQELSAARNGHVSSRPMGQMSHAVRRSFADLSDLASVAECAPLAMDSPDVKRRRSVQRLDLMQQQQNGGSGLLTAVGSGRSLGRSSVGCGGLVAECSLQDAQFSVPEHAPFLLRGGGGGGYGGGTARGAASRHRRTQSGSGLFNYDSPAKALLQQHVAGVARLSSAPQPIRREGAAACGLGAGGSSTLQFSLGASLEQQQPAPMV